MAGRDAGHEVPDAAHLLKGVTLSATRSSSTAERPLSPRGRPSRSPANLSTSDALEALLASRFRFSGRLSA